MQYFMNFIDLDEFKLLFELIFFRSSELQFIVWQYSYVLNEYFGFETIKNVFFYFIFFLYNRKPVEILLLHCLQQKNSFYLIPQYNKIH